MLLILLSAILLFLSFPVFELNYLAWVGFIPLFVVIQNKKKSAAFWLSYLCGFLFFLSVIYWLIHVTLVGLIVFCAYLALYFGLFGYAFVYLKKRSPLKRIIILSCLWVVLEYWRAHVFSGFSWALLGYSQYQNIKVIQIADITGAYGVSFLVIFVNLCLFEMISIVSLRVKRSNLKSKIASQKALAMTHNYDYYLWRKLIVILLGVFICVYGYGFYSLTRYGTDCDQALQVTLIQGNIPQEEKWESGAQSKIKDIYFDLTRSAYEKTFTLRSYTGKNYSMTELFIWPETSFPDYVVSSDKNALKQAEDLVKEIKRPLLIGAVYQEYGNYFNSAILLNPIRDKMPHKAGVSNGVNNDIEITNYKKLHLVPFGEYLPLRGIIPCLDKFVPISDFTSGKEYTVFEIRNPKSEIRNKSQFSKFQNSIKFSVLICFEDTIPELSRRFRLKGADFLVNITNDAWFKKTSSPYQHLQASVFRAVENRVYVVRSANTGVSAVIDPYGAIVKRIKDDKGQDIFTRGWASCVIWAQKELSFYSRFGDVFFWFCLLVLITGLLRKKRPQ